MAKIEWKGGECPVPHDTLVKIYRRDGGDLVSKANKITWCHIGTDIDVVEYEVIEEAKDSVNHPEHYTSHPSGIEAIQITEHMSFCLGNAVKYIWRADLKGNALEDLKKAEFYIKREIHRREELKQLEQ